MKPKKMKNVAIWLSLDDWLQVKRFCADHRISVSTLARTLLLEKIGVFKGETHGS